MRDGYSDDQSFYMACGQNWREKYRESRTRAQLLSNPHSPSAYRVNVVVRNDDSWTAAFPKIKQSDKYWLPSDQQVRLW